MDHPAYIEWWLPRGRTQILLNLGYQGYQDISASSRDAQRKLWPKSLRFHTCMHKKLHKARHKTIIYAINHGLSALTGLLRQLRSMIWNEEHHGWYTISQATTDCCLCRLPSYDHLPKLSILFPPRTFLFTLAGVIWSSLPTSQPCCLYISLVTYD